MEEKDWRKILQEGIKKMEKGRERARSLIAFYQGILVGLGLGILGNLIVSHYMVLLSFIVPHLYASVWFMINLIIFIIALVAAGIIVRRYSKIAKELETILTEPQLVGELVRLAENNKRN